MPDGEVLQDRPDRPVIRHGDRVHHPVHPWQNATVALLRHLEAVDFPAPRVVSVDEREEVLTFLPGDSGGDGWARAADEDGLVAMARLLRRYHDAVRGWRPAEGYTWYDGTTGTGDDDRLVLHGDFGPWNLVWSGTAPVGVLDWEHARVGLPLEDLAYAVEWTAPFCDDAEAQEWRGFPDVPDRVRRIRLFAAAYGIDTDGVVDAVLSGQDSMLRRVERMAAAGQERQRLTIAEGWHDEAIARHAWCVANRDLFGP